MGRTIDGRQMRMLKMQLSALAAATFRMGITYADHSVQMDGKVVGAFELWSLTEEGQRVLWPATLRLSTDYFESLSRYAVPLDERAIAALAFAAVALDVYCWLAQASSPHSSRETAIRAVDSAAGTVRAGLQRT